MNYYYAHIVFYVLYTFIGYNNVFGFIVFGLWPSLLFFFLLFFFLLSSFFFLLPSSFFLLPSSFLPILPSNLSTMDSFIMAPKQLPLCVSMNQSSFPSMHSFRNTVRPRSSARSASKRSLLAKHDSVKRMQRLHSRISHGGR